MKQNLCVQVASTTNCIWTCMYFFILVTMNKSRFPFNRHSLKSVSSGAGFNLWKAISHT